MKNLLRKHQEGRESSDALSFFIIKGGKNIMKLELKTKSGVYTAETIDITFGTLEDILNALDFDNLSDTKQVGIAVLKMSKQLKPFIQELFPDASDEDIRSAKTSNLIEIFKGLYQYATQELGKVGEATKN